jgi:hypothetical protein
MEIKVDTKHDTHEDIRKVIRMLQHIVGEEQSAPSVSPVQEPSAPEPMPTQMSGFFEQSSTMAVAQESMPASEPQLIVKEQEKSETDDLFAELFSDEELKKMEPEPVHEEAEEEPSRKSPYSIEIY